MKTLTPIEFWSLAATIFNLYTYWLANEAGLIGMGLGQSAVLTQTSTTVANRLPAGGAFGVGVTAAMLNTRGFTAGEITPFVARRGRRPGGCVGVLHRDDNREPVPTKLVIDPDLVPPCGAPPVEPAGEPDRTFVPLVAATTLLVVIAVAIAFRLRARGRSAPRPPGPRGSRPRSTPGSSATSDGTARRTPVR